MDRIFLSPPDAGELERAAILRAFDSGWIAPVGEELNQFEVELAAYVGAESAVAVSSGTAALRLALALHEIGPGDEVVVASATFAASAFAVAHAGASPVFCDSEADTWCLDPDLLREFLRTRANQGKLPKAVMPVSLYGSAPQYQGIKDACDEYGVVVIEDAAEALGSHAGEGPVGSLDHTTVFSFNGNKIITSSSGGVILGSPDQMARVRYLATQARMPEIYYEHTEIGFNFRLSNLLAALGRAQLERLEAIVGRLTEINRAYVEAFPDFDWCPYANTPRPNHWLSVALMPAVLDPLQLSRDLNDANIEARPAWKPMHMQPVFKDAEMIGSGAVSADLFHRGLCLPSGSVMTDQDLERVIGAVRQAVEQ